MDKNDPNIDGDDVIAFLKSKKKEENTKTLVQLKKEPQDENRRELTIKGWFPSKMQKYIVSHNKILRFK